MFPENSLTLHRIFPQSGSQNVGFLEPVEEQQLDSLPNQSDLANVLPGARDAGLGEFLSRPLKVFSTTWSATAPVSFNINPIQLFLTSARVANRLTNFKLYKSSFKIKIICNGNSFYMGRALVAWNPLSSEDDYFYYTNADPLITFGHSVRLSQRQHIMIDPSQSAAGEIDIPFIWDSDFFDVPAVSANAARFGSLSCSTLVPLSLITEPTPGSVNPVAITIYVWAENVVMGGLTVEDIAGLVAQSGPDEYSGTVSSLASTISLAASKFVSAPYIGPYAMATSIASGAVASIAKLFGFSKPCMLEDAIPMRPTPVTSMATCVGKDGSVKLTVDPKQEVSIDPRIIGLGAKDDMDIVNIASVRSLVANFNWDYTQIYGTLLYTTLVDPGICYRVSDANKFLYVPACCGATLPFHYWSGSLEFTFEIVATAYHRGRLAFVYDPHRTPLIYETNVAYHNIVDISECRKVTIRIGQSQIESVRNHFQPLTSGEFFSASDRGGHGTVAITPTQILNAGNVGNGVLSVFVVNDLTAPNTTTNGIKVLMYVNACEDFRVYAPNSELYDYSYVYPQSGVEPIKEITTNTECPPYRIDIRSSDPGLAKIYCGENILSIRTILKRYVHYLTHHVTYTAVANLTNFEHAIYPLMYLNAVDTIHSTAVPGPINYVGHSYISYFRAAFTAIRGGTRWKVIPTKPFGPGKLSATLHADAITGLPAEIVINAGANTKPRGHLVANRTTHQGETMTLNPSNPGLEFEVPFYSNKRFIPAASSLETKFAINATGFRVLADINAIGETCSLYVASAEDFGLYHFHGFPTMVCNSSVIPIA